MDFELEKQILNKTIENLGSQLSQCNIELAYIKSQNEIMASQLQFMQQTLEKLSAEQQEQQEEVIHTEAFAPGLEPDNMI